MNIPRPKPSTQAATPGVPPADSTAEVGVESHARATEPAAQAVSQPRATGNSGVKSYDEGADSNELGGPAAQGGGVPAQAYIMGQQEADARVANQVHRISLDLAITQAMNPNERDKQGFSNADYPLAFVLLAHGDTSALGRLLLLYPRQREAMGLSREDLVAFLTPSGAPQEAPEGGAGAPEGEGQGGTAHNTGFERQAAISALREVRQSIRGQVGWAQLDDGRLLFNGVQVPSTATRILTQFCGPRTLQGWYMRPEDSFRALQRLLRERMEILNLDKLKAIAEPFRTETPELVQDAAPLEVLDPELAMIDASYTDQHSAGIVWSNPFSEAGNTVRTVLKDLGGTRWSGDKTKGWITPFVEAYALCVLLEGRPHLETSLLASKLETKLTLSDRERAESLAEEIQTGRMVMRITGRDESNIWFVGRRKHQGISDALYQNHLGRWDGEKFALRISLDKVETLLKVCDQMEDLDLSAFIPIVHEYQERRLQRMESRVAITIPERTPGGMALMPHQPEAVQFLLGSGWDHPSIKGGLLGDDMGLGKSLAAIFAAHLKAPTGRKLVVCPASLKENWRREILKVMGPDETIQVVKTGKDLISQTATWVICNYDLAKAHAATLKASGFSVGIADEAHSLKNPATDRTKAVLGYDRKPIFEQGVFDFIPTVWDLTATPVLNRPKELHPLLRSFRHPLGENFFTYGVRFCGGHQTKYGWDFDGASNLDELGKEIASVYLKRYKSKVLNLPPKIRQDVLISLPPADMKAYKEGLKSLLERFKSSKRAKGEAEDAEIELDPVEEENVLTEIGAMKQATALAKVPATIDMVQEIVESGGKVLVWSCYHNVMDQIEAAFPGKVVRIDGTVSNTRRMQAVDLFQEDPEIQVFVLSIKAGGVGLNLTAAGYEVFNDEEWVPALNDQAEDRAYRIGTTMALNVRKMVAEGTFDEPLRAILDEKRDTISAFEGFSAEAAQAAMSKGVVYELIKRLRQQQRAEKKATKKAS